MVHKGELIVACDPDLGDMYCCEVVRGDEENTRNILCRVLFMIAYPIQHAILDGSVPNENPPLGYGTVARLKFVHREIYTGGIRDYETSVSKCLAEYRKRREFLYHEGACIPEGVRRFRRPDPKEFEILDRHAERKFEGRRAVCAV